MARFSTNPNAGGVGRSEHVSLETDLSETRAKPNLSRPLARFEFRNGGRGATKSIAILPDQYVAVETQRSNASFDTHTVDMRFVDPKPFRIRSVPWRLLYTAIGLTLIASLAVVLCFLAPNVARKFGGVLAAVGLAIAAVGAYAICYYLASEALLFLSTNGRVRMIAIAGRLGTIRRSQSAAADLVTHIKLAQKQFKQSRQAFLRDEMREHSRLYEHGALSEEHYNDARRRILKAHD